MIGCATQTQQPIDISNDTNNPTLTSLLNDAKKANQQSSPTKDQRLIGIAVKLIEIKEYFQAKRVLGLLNPQNLDSENYFLYAMTSSDIFLRENFLSQAKNSLSSARLSSLMDQLTISQQQLIHQKRAALYLKIGDTIAATQEYVALGTLLSSPIKIQNNNDAIWQLLSQQTLNTLNTLQSNNSDDIISGWLTLAIISQENPYNLALQYNLIEQWINEHPYHPANNYLPRDLASLKELIDSQPKSIAVLLPLQGKLAKAGQAIRDGFMAAYYLHNENSPSIKFYDTSRTDINTIYDQAVNDEAELIIGPLEKNKVEELARRETLDTPILALNYIEEVLSSDENNAADKRANLPLYQFGFSIENEVQQIADRAWADGHRQAMILSNNNNWSKRATNAFIKNWEEYGGKIVTKNDIDTSDSYSDTIKDILHIDKSKQRASNLKTLFRRGFEFEPRRRTDIDLIFLAARSKEGRQIKPTLNFHFAGNIPVYATSRIYNSTNNNTKNSDLNGIQLPILPWITSNNIPEKELVNQNIETNTSYDNLYALGVDSFLLFPRLQQLYENSEQQIYGTTGQLSIDNERRISRKQRWVQITKGQLKTLASPTL